MNKIIYSKYSNERADRFKIRTDILEDLNGKNYVQKTALTEEANNHIDDIYKSYILLSQMYEGTSININKCSKIDGGLKFEYLEGITLEEELDVLLLKKEYSKLLDKIKEYVSIIKSDKYEENFVLSENFIKIFGKSELPASLKGSAVSNIDLIFSNIIIGEKWSIIDYEWTFNFVVPVNYIIYRAILCYISNSSIRSELMSLDLYKILGITNEELVEYEKMEKNFNSYVSEKWIPLSDLYGKTIKNNINIDKMIEDNALNLFKDTIQIFYDYGEGFNEENSYEIQPLLDSQGKVEIEISVTSAVKQIRIDPARIESIIKIDDIVGYKTGYYCIKYNSNGIKLNGVSILFLNDDPQIILENIREGTTQIQLKFYIQSLPKEITVELSKIIDSKETYVKRIEKVCEEKEKISKDKEKIEEYLISTLEHVNKLENLLKDKEKIEEYLDATLNHVNKLENIIKSHTIKGRIKGVLRKLGFRKESILYLVIKNPNFILKGILEVKRSGISGLRSKIKGKKNAIDGSSNYANQQVKLQQELSPEIVKNEIEKFDAKPIFSIIMPVYNVEKRWIEKAIQSITNQTYEYWELCIVDDCSTKLETIEYIEAIKNTKIKVLRLQENKGISEASNIASKMAIGEYLILMDNDDEIREEALYEVAKAINELNPDILYSDEDKITIDGTRRFPFFKPDWSPDLLYSQMYICHLLTIKKEIFDKVGGFRTDFNGSQDYDLMLRMSEFTQNIYHIPKILYSWREIPSSTAMNPDSKPYAHIAGLKALNEHLKRKYSKNAYAKETENLFVYDARYGLNEGEVKVSIIMPTKDKLELLKPCVESILEKTKYANYEILILNNNSTENETYDWFKNIQEVYSNIKVIDAFYEFNWSKLNNHGIKEASGEVYVFLNNDTIIITPDWLERLAENAVRDDIGTVGALLLYEDETIQHAGIVLGMGGWADHVFKGMEPIHFGSPYVSAVLNRNVLACTGACLAISKSTIDKIGPFDEKFIICGSDVEISLRARKYGLNNLYNARVKLYHLESKSRDSYIPQIDFDMSKLHYQEYLDMGDPYYNPQLDLASTSPKIKG